MTGSFRRAALAAAALVPLAALPLDALAVSCRPATPAEAAVYTTPLLMPGVISPRDGTCYVDRLLVPTADGVLLTANVFLPAGAGSGARFPAVVYPSSWAAADFFEYLGQQQRMAQDGYVALAYTARGFWGSGGIVGVAGPADVDDVSRVVDWLLANTPADGGKVGFTGISYGAGLSMLGAAADARIRAVASLSGWGTLIDQMYGNAVPNPTWLSVLTLSGSFTGRLDPIVYEYDAAIRDPDLTPAKLAEITAWGAPRSPSTAVAALNARQVPVFIGKNWQDDMFSPNSTLAMFSQLTGPKKVMLQPGIHASAELPGATLGLDNAVFDQVHRWMDRWLKGVPNGIESEPKVTMQLAFGGAVDRLSTWPAPELRTQTWQIGAKGPLRWELGCFCWKGITGTLTAAAPGYGATDRVSNGLDTTATTGPIPILSPLMSSIGLPVIDVMGTILAGYGTRYASGSLSSTLKLRGSPRLQIRATPSQSRGMLVAYLYDVDLLGIGTLVTHGARALHWATPGVATDLSFDLNAIAYDVPAGHHVELVVDTIDSLYGSPVRPGESFAMSLPLTAGSGMTLSLPVR